MSNNESFVRKHVRKVYMPVFIAGVVLTIAATSGWMGAMVPACLLVAAAAISQLDPAGKGAAASGVLWTGVAILIALAEHTFGWTWFLYVVALVPAYMGLVGLLAAINDTLTGMYRS